MIKRYDIEAAAGDFAYLEVEECECGDWIKAHDYSELCYQVSLLIDRATFHADLLDHIYPDHSEKLKNQAEKVLELIE